MDRNRFGVWRWLTLCAAFVLVSDIAISQVDAFYDIYAMDLKTGRVFQVSHVPGRGEYNPSWSPDNSFIVHDVFDPLTITQSLGITNVRTKETFPLKGTAGGNNAAWSSCGLFIAYDLCPGFGHGCDPRIFVTTPFGLLNRLLIEDAQMPGWSPDSRRIVFSRASDGSIYTVDILGKNVKLVASSLGYGGMVNPKWSPDGKWIAFEWYGWIEKVRVDKEGNPLSGVVDVFVNDGRMYGYYPTWSSDSKRIAFGGNGAIWSIPATGGTLTMLLPMMNGQGAYDPAYSSFGRYIAFDAYTVPLEKPAVAEEPVVPSEFSLSGAYPNPFNPTTTIEYDLPKACHVSLVVFDALGNEVSTLVNEEKPAGHWTAKVDGSRLASGVYFYRLQTAAFVATKKMVLVK